MRKRKESKAEIFSNETIGSLVELGEVLRRIHNRLITEGYEIKDGCIVKKI